jgi:hypothetical protein
MDMLCGYDQSNQRAMNFEPKILLLSTEISNPFTRAVDKVNSAAI